MNGEFLIALGAFIVCAVIAALLLRSLPRIIRHLRFVLGERLADELGRSFVFVQRRRLLLLNLGAMILSLAIVWGLGGRWWLAAAAAVIVSMSPGLVLSRISNTRRRRFRSQVPELLNLLSGGLRAGNAVSVVISQLADEMAAPAGQEMALLQREQRMGASFAEALDRLERRVPLEETVLFCAAMKLGSRSGGGIADTLDALADATRRKLALEGKVRALTAQGRLQAWVMGMLPFLIVGLLSTIEPVLIDGLLDDWGGRMVCAYVLVSQACGLAMIRKIVRIDI